MKKEIRASLVRVLVDLIKADIVIDESEMKLYAKLKDDYGITRDDEIEASTMTLADAVQSLSESPRELQDSLLSLFSKMALSDGFCNKKEAQLMIALKCCLSEDWGNMCSMYSVHEPDVPIEDNLVLYVETSADDDINRNIVENYRYIDKELRLAGFHFVYVPHIVNHFSATSPTLFYEITRFLAPNIAEENIPSLANKLTNITTAEYCNEQLCNKLGMRHLRDVPPSLLIKICSTHVGEQLYTNFVRITIDGDVLQLVQEITDAYCKMLSSDHRIISNNEEAFGRFLYYGFYKQLYDIYVIKKGVSSKIVIDIDRGQILLPDLDIDLKGIFRKERALYTLLLLESPYGGINLSRPKSAKQRASYEVRVKDIMNKYRRLYGMFNGDKAATPMIDNPRILRPMISNISRTFRKLQGRLHNMEDYNVTKDSFNSYTTGVSLDMVYVIDRSVTKEAVPVVESRLYKQLYGKG